MTIDWLERFVSADVGIIHRVDEGLTAFDHPRLATHTATISDTGPVLDVHLDPKAGGIASDLHTSRSAAIGEALERYSASHVPQSLLYQSRRSDLTGTALGLRTLPWGGFLDGLVDAALDLDGVERSCLYLVGVSRERCA